MDFAYEGDLVEYELLAPYQLYFVCLACLQEYRKEEKEIEEKGRDYTRSHLVELGQLN